MMDLAIIFPTPKGSCFIERPGWLSIKFMWDYTFQLIIILKSNFLTLQNKRKQMKAKILLDMCPHGFLAGLYLLPPNS